MNFGNEKKQCLAKIDKSKKQSLDKAIKPIVDFLNSHDDYYTTSSCSGRVMLIEKPGSGRKNDAKWIYVAHGKADAGKIIEAINNPEGKDVWLKQEGAILHVCCRTMDAAGKLIGIVKDAGFKRSGLINFKKRIILEIISTELVEAPVIRNGKVIAESSYISEIIGGANRNMEKNRTRMENLFKSLANKLGK